MTRQTNARIAGFTFLFYIVAGIASLALKRPDATAVVSVLTSLSALVLGVTLYALTREQDPDLAMLGLVCRVVEAIPGNEGVGAIFFAVGSTAFAWLLLRGRMIPVPLAQLGVAVSILLVALLLLQRGGLLGGTGSWTSPVTWAVWFPMLVFEVTLAFWLVIKGVAATGSSVE